LYTGCKIIIIQLGDGKINLQIGQYGANGEEPCNIITQNLRQTNLYHNLIGLSLEHVPRSKYHRNPCVTFWDISFTRNDYKLLSLSFHNQSVSCIRALLLFCCLTFF